MTLFLGLLETQGNQSYVYATNRERNARGASELLQASTTTWVLDALGINHVSPLTTAGRADLLRTQSVAWFGSPGDTTAVNIVVATSGRAVLLCRSHDPLRKVISNVTTRALRDALEGVKNLAGAHGVFNMSARDHLGLDQRAAVMVKIENGTWKYQAGR